MTDVGSAGQRQQLQLSGGALGAGDIVLPAGEEKDEEEVAADRRAAAAGFQGPRHLLKVYLTDGVNRVVALDTQGVLAASYQQRCASAGRSGPVPSLHAFYAGAKVRLKTVALFESMLTYFSCSNYSLLWLLVVGAERVGAPRCLFAHERHHGLPRRLRAPPPSPRQQ